MPLDFERERLVYMSKLAEEAERFDDVIKNMEKIAKLNVELSLDERRLLSSGYKNAIGDRRAACRILSINERKEESEGNEDNVRLIKVYRQEIQEELTTLCNNVLALIDEHLIPYASSVVSKVFYYKMKGDYYRYLAEFKKEQKRNEAVEISKKAYQIAYDIASNSLQPAHPIRLGVALNFSVFYYEIEKSLEKACDLAKQAFEDAFLELDSLNEESYKDSTFILQLLTDNITLWRAGPVEEEAEVDEKMDAPAEPAEEKVFEMHPTLLSPTSTLQVAD